MGRWLKRSRAAARRFKRTRSRRTMRRRTRARSSTTVVKRALRQLQPLCYYDQLGSSAYNLSDGWDWSCVNAAVMPFSGMPTAGTTSFVTLNQQQVVRSNRFQVYSIDCRFNSSVNLGVGTPPVSLPLRIKCLVLGTHHPTAGLSTPLTTLGPLDYTSTWLRTGSLSSYNSPLSQENMWRVLHVYEDVLHRDAAGISSSSLVQHHSFRVKFPKPWNVELIPNTGSSIANSEIAKGQVWFVFIISMPTDPAVPTTRQVQNVTFRIGFRNQG